MNEKIMLKRLLDDVRASVSGSTEALERFVQDQRVGEVLDTSRAAAYCGLAKGTLYNLASRREGPVQHKHGRKTVYYPVDLDVFLFSRVRQVLADAA